MVLENKLLMTCTSLLLLTLGVRANLPELATKQAIQNIRYVSNDGLLTYYQNRKGILYYSSNYTVKPVLEKSPNTFYTVNTSIHKKFLIAEVQESFFKVASFQADHQLYAIPYGSSKSMFIGRGQASRLHEKGTWVSFYSFMKNKITLLNIESPLITTILDIKNSIFPYFIPEVLFFNKNFILYTDINKKGEQAVILFTREDREKSIFLQSDTFGQNFQLCQNDKNIFILQTGQSNHKKGTQIYLLKKKDPLNIKSLKSIYTSFSNDTGNMVCDFDSENIYFIKSKPSRKYSAAKNIIVKININTSKLEAIYDDKPAFNFFHLDQKLVLTTQGRYYILRGTSKLRDDSIK